MQSQQLSDRAIRRVRPHSAVRRKVVRRPQSPCSERRTHLACKVLVVLSRPCALSPLLAEDLRFADRMDEVSDTA